MKCNQNILLQEVPFYLTAPFPCYLSLQTALYHHGMIEQVPDVVYAVSLARTQRVTTGLGAVSIHHVDGSFFFGYEADKQSGVLVATPEKALLDFFYLTPARSALFRALPEIELPRSFSAKKARATAKKISFPSRRQMVLKRLEALLERD